MVSEDALELLVRSFGGVLQLIGVGFVLFSIEGTRRWLGRQPLPLAAKTWFVDRQRRTRSRATILARRMRAKLNRLRGRQSVTVSMSTAWDVAGVRDEVRARIGWPTHSVDWASLSDPERDAKVAELLDLQGERLSRIIEQLQDERDALRAEIKELRHETTSEDHRIERRVEGFAGGDLRQQVYGAMMVFIGIILSTWPREIAGWFA